MIISPETRLAVIENIKHAVKEERFDAVVEPNDPVLTPDESKAITDRYLASRKKFSFRAKAFAARRIANVFTRIDNKDSEIIGLAFDILLKSPTFSQARMPQQEFLMPSPKTSAGSVVYYDLEFAKTLIHSYIYDDITFDIIYIDPPYASNFAENALSFIFKNSLFNAGKFS